MFQDLSVGTLRPEKLTINSTVIPSSISYTIGSKTGGTTIAVSGQLKDGDGKSISQICVIDIWLSDASTGLGLVSAAPSGGVTATVGTIITSYTANKHFKVATNSSGIFTLSIVEAGVKSLYVVVENSATGKIEVSSVVTF